MELAKVPSENYFPGDSNHVDSKVEKIIKINQETRRLIRPNRDCLLNRLLSSGLWTSRERLESVCVRQSWRNGQQDSLIGTFSKIH